MTIKSWEKKLSKNEKQDHHFDGVLNWQISRWGSTKEAGRTPPAFSQQSNDIMWLATTQTV